MKNSYKLIATLLSCLLIGISTVSAQQAKRRVPTTLKRTTQSEPQQRYNGQSSVKWTAEPFNHKLFIKNEGQFDKKINSENEVLYGAQVGKAEVYFTSAGLTYRYKDAGKPFRKEAKGAEREAENENSVDETVKYTNITWEGANPDATIEAVGMESYPYIYPSGISGSIQAQVFTKIIYHNLYPGIDVEYTFPKDKDGIKYALIVHSGANLSVVKLKYNGVDHIKLNENGDAIINTDLGEITDHAPISFYRSGQDEVTVYYTLQGGVESFAVKGAYDNTKTLVVDPWTTALPFTGGYNDGYDVDYDYRGNIYVQGAWGPVQLVKYNSAGTQQWVFNETTLNTGSSACYGDFAVNRNNGECYCAEGDRETATGANVIKVNTNGALMSTFTGNVNYQEIWRVAYNSCNNMLVLAGGGTDAENQSAVLDTGMVTITLKNVLGATNPYHDMTLLALDPDGNSCYQVSSESCCFSQASADDQLVKMPLPAITPITYKVNAATTGSFPEDIQDVIYMTWSGIPTNGFNGMACSKNFLYTYDGADLHKQNKSTGATITTVSPTTTEQSWGGLDVDACDNVYAGANNKIKVYNSAMSLISTVTATNVVYDLMLGQNSNVIYVTGHKFLEVLNNSNISITTSNVVSPATCGQCNGTAQASLKVCGSIDTTGATYLWSNGATTHTITGLCAGTYVCEIIRAGQCQKFADTVTVVPGSGLAVGVSPSTSFCVGGSTVLTATGATTYTWSPGTGLSATTGASVTANPGSTQTYTVTGTTGACTGTATVTITITPPPIVTATASPASICLGSSTTITGGGATTYSWSTGATTASITGSPGSTNTYTVTGTTGGCTGSATVTVVVNLPPDVGVNSPTICSGESAILTASGALTYSWSTGATTNPITVNPATTTSYTVTGTDANGCTKSVVATVTVNPSPTIAVNSPTICNGTNATLTGSGGTSYSWSTGATTTSITVSPASTTSYTVTGTDANGCTNSAVATVTVNPILTVTATASPASICLGSSTTITGGGATTYSWSDGETTISIIVNPATTTTYTVTGTSAGCTGSTTVIVTVNPPPTITVNSPTICSGTSAVLTGSGGTSYSWSTGATTTSITVSPASTTSYTVTGTDANGCTNSAVATVTVGPGLAVTATASPTSICAGSSTTITGGGATTYSWSTGSTTTSISVSPASTTTYTVTGTSGGCTGSATVSVTVNPLPTVTATASPTSICAGSSTTITGGGATTYSWSDGETTNPISVSPVATTSYTVTGTDGNGCTNTTTVLITVNPPPTVTVNSASICDGSSAILTASGTPNYTWSPGTGLSATTGTSVTANPATTTTYTVTGTDGNGCTNSAVATVTVNPPPTITVNSATICSGTSATLTGSGGTSYSWSTSATTTSITVSPASTTSYTVTGTDVNGCTNSAVATVTVAPSLAVTVSPSPANMCIGSTTSLTASGGTTYSWSTTETTTSITVSPVTTTTYSVTGLSGGCTGSATVSVIVNPLPTITVNSPTICNGSGTTLTGSGGTSYSWSTGSTSNPLVVNPATTTSYTVTGTDANGCSNTAVATVTVNPQPTITVNSPTICDSTNATLTGSGGVSYSWSDGETTNPITTVNLTTTTSYTVTGTDANGCTNTAVATVTVNPPPTITVSSSVSSAICAGDLATLTASGATSYSWSDGETTNPININPTTTTTYMVTGTTGGCTASATVTVTVNPRPVIDSSNAVFPPICSGTLGSITGVTTGGGTGPYTYSWNPSGQTTSDATGLSAGSYTLTVTDANGCTSTSGPYTITNSIVIASFTANPDSGTVPLQVNFTNTSTGANSYEWNLGNGDTTNVVDPSTTYGNTGEYNVELIATNSDGCTDTAYGKIEVHGISILIVPNVFSPNGDGRNDVFKVQATNMTTFDAQIFDRWGIKLYEWYGANGGWDGRTTSGVEVPSGTYYYLITAIGSDGKKYVAKGYLTLLK